MLLFLVDLINIEIFRISFSFFYSFSFILRSRATSSTHYKDHPCLSSLYLIRINGLPLAAYKTITVLVGK